MERIRPFGQLDDGRAVHAYRLGGDDGICAEVLDLGGILARLQVPGANGRVDAVLRLPDARAYLADPAYLGILVGRYGNRIGGARFSLAGREHALSANEGRNHLHGGHLGFGRRLWDVESHTADTLVLRLRSPEGEEGYPGNLDVVATYRVHGTRLELLFEARSDASTPFNPTHHPYFNLAGDANVPAASQVLQVPVAGVLPVADDLIPLGRVEPADGTPFDFRTAATLRSKLGADDPQLRVAGGFDHCLVLEPGHACAAQLYSPHSGVAMRIDCDAPALQLYGGQGLARQHPGLGDGLCLEPQDYPDAPNHPGFPPAVLRPGTAYRRRILYRFGCPGCDCAWDDVAAALARA
ncbi:galactose mutarotase [Luteimonas sp. M1R5S59]|uniref:Aldose 1-epimerase n=1 Tax=Luteimonas kalidii TaxID=3042025 RepID=A0ABT6JPU2_9GAMM|nr:aldose epimerase family protein [Luteimonas kalidii]MDH5832527.1 galactose mutarotase [Luteimonas kalidii]